MAYYPSKGESLWLATADATTYGPLEGNLTIDVAIVGGGIAGLTAAYLLKQRGLTVAVLEKHTIGSGVTGYTTAKVTSQHSLTYAELVKKHGEEIARLYGEANQAALAEIQAIIARERIECGWRSDDNYVFTEDPQKVAQLQDEATVAARLGLPAQFVTETSLPFSVAGAVKFENQGTFHVLRYLQGLAKAVHGRGSFVFENTKATRYDDGTPCSVMVGNHTITAKHVILATNAPDKIKDHIAYAAVEYPTRSYIVASKMSAMMKGMYISADSPTRSLLPVEIDNQLWLLVGGDGHFVGKSGPAAGHYENLATYTKERFGIATSQYQWSTWDFVAYDKLPLIGKLYPWSKHTYVMTGLRKWGMTNATVGGMLLADELTGVKNPWTSAFRSNRSSAVTSLPKGLLQGLLS